MPDPEEIIESWGFQLEEVGKTDLRFSRIEEPYGVFSQEIETDTDRRSAAETVIAFHKYKNEALENQDAGEKIREATGKLQEYMEKGIIRNDLHFLYDDSYVEELKNKVEGWNMAREIGNFEDGRLEDKKDYVQIEKELISKLLGENYN